TGIGVISTRIPGLVLAGGRGEYHHASSDGGSTWTSNRLLGVTTNITGIAPRTTSEWYVSTGSFGGSGSGNGVYKTINGGVSWTQHGLLFTPLIGLDISYDDRLLAATQFNEVLEGRVATTTWTSLPSPGVDVRIFGYYRNGAQSLRQIVGGYDALCDRPAGTPDPWTKRVLGGLEVSWFRSVLAGGLGPASFPGQVILGTYGGGVFQSTGPLTSVGENKSIPSQFALEQNYPNPFNPVTNFQFSIANSQLTILKVYDLLGREVATLVNEVKRPGRYEVQWDASNFSSGVYFYRMQTGSFHDTKKLILAK
ncbi:MAG: T9SS type A sorting domain-containing protein, partial [Bacteroidota bacterium]